MRFSLLLLLLLTVACAPARSGPGSPQPGTPVAVPQGAWLVTLTSADLGELRVPMHFEARRGGGFEAHSRAGALARTLGGGRALLARLFGGSAFERGALLHIVQGESEARGDTLRLRGLFLSPVVGRRQLTGTLVDGRISAELRRPGSAAVWGTLHAAPAEGMQPIRDYSALTREVRQVIAERIYNPTLLETPRWRTFFSRLERRLPTALDDAEALMVFFLAAQALEISHFALLGERVGEHALPQGSSGTGAAPPVVQLRFPQPGVAHLVIRHFAGTPEPIEHAFAELHAAGARTLIVDLRGNTGGNLSSMSVAAHLLREETPAGVFVGPVWWSENTTLPDLRRTDGLPVLAAFDLEAFFLTLREHGVLAGRVRPREPHFGGRVYALIDSGTASAAEPLAELLKRSGRAVLIGERTAGAMLSSERVPLQTGLVLLVPTADFYTAEGQRLEGAGVEPQVKVPSAQALEEALRRATEPE